SFTAPDVLAGTSEDLTFRLSVSDGAGGTTTDDVVITVQEPVNTAPTVNAGPDQTVIELTVVQLAGAASDINNDPLTYSWTQTVGPMVTLTNADTPDASFTAPDVLAGTSEDLTFRLSVSDGAGGTTTDDVVITVQEPGAMVVLSGVAEYEFPPPNNNCNGLNFNALIVRPIRGAPVQIIDATTSALIASTTTSDTGFYSVNIDGGLNVIVRIRSQLIQSGNPSWDVDVRNNTANTGVPLNQRPLYFLDSAPFNTGVVNLTQDLLAETGWGVNSFTGVRAAAPFAVMDSVYEMMQLLVSADPTINFPALDAFWSPDNNSSEGTGDFFADIDTGDIGTSFYAGGSLGSLFLLGMDGDDIEEFDDHVIAHEWGHYFEDKFSRSDSIGGAHSLGDQLDMRLAFSEGFATALAGIALGPMYCDTLWFGNTLSGFEVDIENAPNAGFAGWFNELSVMQILYDLWDSNDEGGDSMSIGFAPLYDVMTGAQRTTAAFTSIFSFVAALKALPNAETAFIDAQLAREDILGPGLNLYGDGEPNDGPGTPPDVLPIYTDITLGNTVRICSNSQFDSARTGNKLSEVRYLRLNLQSTGTRTFTVDTVDPDSTPSPEFDCTTAVVTDPEIHEHSDPDLQLWRNGQLLLRAWSCEPNQEIATSGVLTPGDYVIDLAEFRYADADSRADFPEQTCFDVTIN
ncbi:MAG: hypothetical protein IIB74_13045, partial [Proteobacteria bacterium]|nr:hypothetical protein [Pseudomonadota bacterium]